MSVARWQYCRGLMRWCFAGVTVAYAGCAAPSKQTDDVEKPKPVLVRWHDLANTDVPNVRNDCVTISPMRAGALFPCSLAVVRVTGLEEPNRNGRSVARLAMTPPNELIDWTNMFDDVWEISEVFPLSYPLALRGRAVRISELLERAEDGGASLCIVYQVVDDSETFTEVRGAIYETSSGRTLSAVQAEAHGAPPVEDELPPPYPGRIETDRRHVDPHFLAQDSFRGFARECVLELVARENNQQPPGGAKLTADR